MSEEMFGEDKIKNNKKISRLMLMMALLFQKVKGKL